MHKGCGFCDLEHGLGNNSTSSMQEGDNCEECDTDECNEEPPVRG